MSSSLASWLIEEKHRTYVEYEKSSLSGRKEGPVSVAEEPRAKRTEGD
jgi:hypothetical protein